MKVEGGGTACGKGLTIRAIELGEWFDSMVTKSANVKQIAGWQNTREGDYAFSREFRLVLNPFDLRVGDNYRHSMLLAERATDKTAKVYSHTTNLCGMPTAHFETVNGTYFRIEPSPLDGAWVSAGGDGRFQLTIVGRKVEWKENRKAGDGTTFTRSAMLEENKKLEYILQRRNDDDSTLQNLGFTESAVRQAILSKNPEPSTLTLTWDGAKFVGIWRGLAVRKNPNGSFKEIVQPSSSTGKEFTFERQ